MVSAEHVLQDTSAAVAVIIEISPIQVQMKRIANTLKEQLNWQLYYIQILMTMILIFLDRINPSAFKGM